MCEFSEMMPVPRLRIRGEGFVQKGLTCGVGRVNAKPAEAFILSTCKSQLGLSDGRPFRHMFFFQESRPG